MTRSSRARARLLLVDDDDAFRRSITRWLEARLPVRVTAVATGEQALALVLAGERFDGAVLDWEMPGIDGIELMGRLARLAPGMPCGIWSASERLRDIDASGASFSLLKGDPRQLAQAVEWMLDASGAAGAGTPSRSRDRAKRGADGRSASGRTPRSSEVRRRIDSGSTGEGDALDDSGTEDV